MPSIYPSQKKVAGQLDLKKLKPEDFQNIKGINYIIENNRVSINS